MHSKRSLIRMLARILYACGFVLLVAGILLSAAAATYANPPAAPAEPNAFNAVEVPFTGIQNSLPLAQATIDPTCGCIRTPTAPVATQPSGSPSSLVFTDGCNCSCDAVTATICNVGGDMQGEVKIQLYYSANGNPTSGEVVKSGPIAPLASGKCLALNYTPTKAGNYAFHVRQESGAVGPKDVWSSACMVSGSCYQPPTPTETPFQPATSTPTVPTATEVPTYTATAPAVEITLTPTAPGVTPATPTQPVVTPPTATETSRPPTATATQPSQTMPFNLSFICGYSGDNYMLWWVKNNTDHASEFTWRVSGSDEQGSGTVNANSVTYFTTSVGSKTVRLFVGGQLMDSAVSSGPCKENLTLAVVCTENGQLFVARNPNNFNVDYTWTIDNQPGGRGMLPAGGTANLITVPQGSHRVELTWTDTRPGTHTVAITSSPDQCVNTATPTVSPTAPVVEITLTPTETSTVPVIPPTPTSTNTVPVATITPSPTTPGVTPPTPTRTNTPPVVVITTTPIPATPTRTSTAPVVIITTTPTSTSPVTVVTTTPVPPTPTFITPATPTPTQTPQVIVVTPVPTETPRIIVVTPIPTDTPQIIVVTPIPTDTPQVIVATPVPTQTPQIVVVTPVPTQTPQIIVVTPIPTDTPQGNVPVTGPTATATGLVTLAPPVVVITTTPALIPETGADLIGPTGLFDMGSLGGLFTNLGLFMLGTALALTGIRSLLSR